MKSNYPKAYTEVLEILKYLPKYDVDKIPQNLIDTFEYKKDKNYNFIIDENQDFSNLNILDETEAIIANLFKDYWATSDQKAKIKLKMQEDIRVIEEQKREKYNSDVFANVKNENNNVSNMLVKSNVNENNKFRKSWFNRILENILNYLKRFNGK